MTSTLPKSVSVAIRLAVTLSAALALRGFLTVDGAPIYRWYYLTVAIGVAGLLGTRSQLSAFPRSIALPVSVTFLMLMAAVGLPWNSRDRFLSDFGRISVGMTEAQVEAIMKAYLLGTGIRNLPGVKTIHAGGEVYNNVPGADSLAPEGCQVYRHSTEAAWNADWGTVCYRNGRVAGTTFSPD